ncbi:MAG: xanthine dehydrogenase family protein molybdopterin-binding subunit [Anaerolineae bacterium]|nr:xanthine dehydrogenase family protein molybdopterin-binding subunit [Anaerolineae bacterium]
MKGTTTSSAAPDLQVVGTRATRVDAAEKVVGRARFGADVYLQGMLVGKVLRSPHAHARIVSLDTSRAEALAGVFAVVTAADLPETSAESSAGEKQVRDRVLASDKVLFVGHPVAAVAARTQAIAEAALGLIDVVYEVLPPVVDVLESMQPDAPILHAHLRTRSLAGTGDVPTNVASHFQELKGNPEAGFAAADVIVEREFRTTMVHQGYIEPHASTAVWADAAQRADDGSLTVYATTQGSFAVRDHLVELLKLPMSKVRVVPMEVGGAFGGKNSSFVDTVAALLARKARRPVKIVMSRYETFLGTGPSSGSVIRVKMGATKAGKITAATATLFYEAGAYPGSPVGSGAHVMFGPYDIPNGSIEGYDVLVNKPKVDSYRAPGATPACFAVEQVVNELADMLRVDPLDFRLRNSVRNGAEALDGTVHRDIGATECLEAARAHPHYTTPLDGPNLGRGVAHAFWGNWGARSSVTITVNPDGTVALVTASVDITGTRTSTAMQAAEILGLPLDRVKATVGDTDSIGYADVSAGSRTTVASGHAAVKAAHDVIDKMRARAAAVWEVDPEVVTFADATFRVVGDSDKVLTFEALAALLAETGNTVIGVGNVDIQDWGASFGTHIADVEVDPETGKVTLLRYTVVQDVGKAVNPVQVEGQLQGGATQGIGWALYEGYDYSNEGLMRNANLLDYKLPTSLDLPLIETVLVEVPYPGHPFGARGVGEVPIMPPPAAIAEAIYQAVGARVCSLPMTPARILEALGVI